MLRTIVALTLTISLFQIAPDVFAKGGHGGGGRSMGMSHGGGGGARGVSHSGSAGHGANSNFSSVNGAGPTSAAGYGTGSTGHRTGFGRGGRGGRGYGGYYGADDGYGTAWGNAAWGTTAAAGASASAIRTPAFGNASSPDLEVRNYDWPSSNLSVAPQYGGIPTTLGAGATGGSTGSARAGRAEKSGGKIDELIRKTNAR